jgi:DNA invertase Pin-like site-specific DNA recombinase
VPHRWTFELDGAFVPVGHRSSPFAVPAALFAEFERAMIRERVMAGLARARAEGKQLGRRTVEQSHGAKVKAALKLRSRGVGIRRIAREVGLGVGTVLRLVGSESGARPA